MPNKLTKEYGRIHDIDMSVDLDMENSAMESTYFPIAATDSGLTDPTTVNVNPYNSNFATSGKSDSHTCYPNSVVNRVLITMTASMPPAGQETGVQGIVFRTSLVTTSFDDIDIEDEVTGSTLGTILGLKKEATNENQVHPIWNGTDIGTTMSTDVVGLTGGQSHESITFDNNDFEDAIESGSARQKLKNICNGGLQRRVIYKDRPFIDRRWYSMVQKAKRMNKGTFCGLLVQLPQASAIEQFWKATETTPQDHLRLRMRVKYTEYNDMFDQGV